MPIATAASNATTEQDSRAVLQGASSANIASMQKEAVAKQSEVGLMKKESVSEVEQVSTDKADEVKEQVEQTGQGWTAAALQKGAELKDTIASSSVVSAILEKGAELKDAVLEKLDELDEAAQKRGAEAREEARRTSKEMEDKVWAEVEREQSNKSEGQPKGLGETANEFKDTAMEKTNQLKNVVLETSGHIVEKLSETFSAVQDAAGLSSKDQNATAEETEPLLESKKNETLKDDTN